MKHPRSSRRLVKLRQRREKATVDPIARALGAPETPAATVHSAYTPSGLAVEDQVRKAGRPWSSGLAMF